MLPCRTYEHESQLLLKNMTFFSALGSNLPVYMLLASVTLKAKASA